MMNKIIMAIAAVLVLMIGAMAYIWSNLDGMVKDAIQTYGSEATQTEVRVGDVKLELEAGKASITGLTVANPVGFTDPNIFELGNIMTTIDTATIRQNLVVIDQLIIRSPLVVYEINQAGVSNVDVLKKNLATSPNKTSSHQANASQTETGDQIKMIIRKLVIEGGKAKVRIAALGKAEQTVNLPRIQLTDVGKKNGGVTAAELAQILSSKLLGNVKNSVASLDVSKYMGKSADAFKKAAMQQAGTVKDSMGGAAGAVGDGLKGLFGK